MEILDIEMNFQLEKAFTPLRKELEKLVKEEGLSNANIVCWVPHEVASLVQLGLDEGLIEYAERFLENAAPEKLTGYEESGAQFGKNFFEHIRAKLAGSVSMSFIVKDSKLYMGEDQDVYFYSPVYKQVPNQKMFLRIMKFD